MKRKAPPGRRSISQAASFSPVASHHCASCSGSVQAANTRAGGASRSRTKRIVWVASSMAKPADAVSVESISLVLRLVAGEMSLEIVEPSFPQDAERLGPFGDGLDRLGPQAARAALRVTPLLDQPGALEHAQMLGNGRLREPERCSQFAYGRLTLRETGQDGSSRRVA